MAVIQKRNQDVVYSILSSMSFPEYNDLLEYRQQVDDCLQGQKVIHEKSQKYLPPNSWQKENPGAYELYKSRALFFNMCSYALKIYDGLLQMGEPDIVIPTELEYLKTFASVYNDGLHSIQQRLNVEQISHGLRCLLLETSSLDQKRPFVIKEYSANKMILPYFINVDGESMAKFVVLNESSYEYDIKTKQYIPIYKLLVLGLDANGEYYQARIKPSSWNNFNVDAPNIFPEEWTNFDFENPSKQNTVYPAYRGKRFNRIPFVWCGASSLSGTSYDIPPLYSMSNVELQLFRAYADYAFHLFMSSQETTYITGVDNSFNVNSVKTGAGAINALTGDNVSIQNISTNGVGFTAQENHLNMLINDIDRQRMSIMSAKSHQSANALQIVQDAQTAPLQIVNSVSGQAITQILRYASKWIGKTDQETASVHYIPSKEFATQNVNLSEMMNLADRIDEDKFPMTVEELRHLAIENGLIKTDSDWKEFKNKWEIERMGRLERSASVIPKNTGNPFSKININSDSMET